MRLTRPARTDKSSPPANFVVVRPGIAQRLHAQSFRFLCSCGRWSRSLLNGVCPRCVGGHGR